MENERIIVNGSILVYGTLIVENSQIYINCTYDREHGVEAFPGANLTLRNSILAAQNSSYRYYMDLSEGAAFRAEGTTFEYSYELHVLASNVAVEGCEFRYCYYGIYMEKADLASVSECEFFRCIYGAYLYASGAAVCYGNSFSDCTFSFCDYGVYMYAYCDSESSNTYVQENSFLGCKFDRCDYGVYMYAELLGSGYRSRLQNNTFANSTFSCCYYGVYSLLGSTSAYLCNNSFYLNNFVSSIFAHVASQGNDFWNNSQYGNYWDDYAGVDEDSDGIGDSPYAINENNTDYKPLMHPWQWYFDQEPPAIVSVEFHPEHPYPDTPVNVKASVVDDVEVKEVVLSYFDGSSWHNVTMEYNFLTGYYEAEIPPYAYQTTVSFRVVAYDWAGRYAESASYDYTVVPEVAPLLVVLLASTLAAAAMVAKRSKP